MAKVTVYVNDEQLHKLKRVKKFGRGGVSRAFQHFIEEMSPGGSGSYDYARNIMPVSAAIERWSRKVASSVAAGGPAADGGPVAAALTVLVHQEILRRNPEVADKLAQEFSKFGLDEMVRQETEGIEDLLAEPAPTDDSGDPDDDDDDDEDFPTARIASALGQELRDVTNALREAGVLAGKGGAWAGKAPRAPRAPRAPAPPGYSRGLVIELDSDDDPREVLTARDFDTFKERHQDWAEGRDLTPEELETITELLKTRYADQTDGGGTSEEG
ncbi:MAG: hypothetical protein ACR2H3_14355 [Acidimicrobiales bacterium]